MPTPTERVVLIGISGADPVSADESLGELEQLTLTAGADVAGRLTQARDKPHVRAYLGPGKIVELVDLVESTGATTVIIDDDVTASQQRHLEDETGCKVLDRTALILDIFAQHAYSSEGKLQVELAQLTYRLPRIRGKGVELSRLGGGIGTRGPGETKLEVDRRRIERRISLLRRELKELAQNRDLQRRRRQRKGVAVACLVGYTNAGKSSLMNALTGADVLVEDKLFATLDSTTRQLSLPSKRRVLLSDTVGFIRKLPHNLVESFRSTFDEARSSALLLVVVDASHPQRREQLAAVREAIGELEMAAIPRIEVYNKVDLLTREERDDLAGYEPGHILVSATTGEGLESLLERIDKELARELIQAQVHIPYADGEAVDLIYGSARVIDESYDEHGRLLTVEVPRRLLGQLDNGKLQFVRRPDPAE